MVGVLVRDEDFRDEVLVDAGLRQRFEIRACLLAHIERSAVFLRGQRQTVVKPGVDEDHLVAKVDGEILQARTVEYLIVERLLAVLAAKGEGLGDEAVLKKMYSLDFHG